MLTSRYHILRQAYIKRFYWEWLSVENFQSHSISTTTWLCAPSHCLLCEHYDNMVYLTMLYIKCSRRLSYASPAWWGFTSADDRNRLEAFVRRSVKLINRTNSLAIFASICDDADNKLFSQITGNSQHLLHPLLPPECEQHYSLRDRIYNFQLPDRTSVTSDKNFIIRMLYNGNLY